MKKHKITTSIYLETRIKNKEGKHPVKLRITYQRERYYFTIKDNASQTIYLNTDDFAKMKGKRMPENLKALSIYLATIETEAIKIIENIIKDKGYFSVDTFKQSFFEGSTDSNDILFMLQYRAENLRKEGRISTAVSFECAINSLRNYIGNNKLLFDKVTPDFLNKYEASMINKGRSITTVGIYLRNVRTIFNEAIKNGIITNGNYPFGSNKYSIPTGENIKKALTLSEVEMIIKYPCEEGTSEDRYRDYWIFSYLCNGINIKDMAKLRYSNIDGDVIRFARSKTIKESRKKPRTITVVITQITGKIIDKWGNKSPTNSGYIFPILIEGMTPEQEYKKIQLTVSYINKYMKQISQNLELKQIITTYTARHSFATVLKRSGASIEFISESLGHANLSTTESYLSDFEIDTKKHWANKLIDF